MNHYELMGLFHVQPAVKLSSEVTNGLLAGHPENFQRFVKQLCTVLKGGFRQLMGNPGS